MTGAERTVSAERLAPAARAQTALPGAEVRHPRRAWEERLAGIWGVTVEGEHRKSNAFLRVSCDRVAVPAGMAQAARELCELRPLDGGEWGGGLIYVVVAAGGAPAGFPDIWDTEEAPTRGGGVRIIVHMPETWAAYAAAGGLGTAPSGGSTRPAALAAPLPMATATLDIAPDYSLRWSYQLDGEELEGPSGRPAERAPVLSDQQLVAAVDAARVRVGAPRAVPAGEPRPLSGRPEVLVVELWRLGPVHLVADGDAWQPAGGDLP